jgi:protein-S-isoprenylcysteine O-methyltransferase Ste14
MSLIWTIVSKLGALSAFALLLFVPAGTVRYWEGWAFLAFWFIPGGLALIYFSKHDSGVLKRRMQVKEKVTEQKTIMKATYAIMFIAFLVAGLDFRFGWTREWAGAVPLWLIVAGLLAALCGRLLTYWVMNVNRYAGRTITVEPGQTVVCSGPYRWVRHPMYFGILMIMLFTPLALGSYVAVPVFALILPLLVLRLLNEEKVLRHDLPGYSEYCQGTPYRLIPYMW